MQSKVGLGVIAVLFVVFCGLFIAATPYRQGGVLIQQNRAYAADIGAPDERQHANYIARLVRGEGIPIFDPADPDQYENYQAHQPPLFYLLASGFAKVASINPQEESGRNLRWFNVLFGLGTILGIYRIGVIGLRDESVGLASAALAGLLPMNIALTSAISNDPLLYCLCTWAIVGCAMVLRAPEDRRGYILFGVASGLAMYTKTSALMLVPVGAVAGFLAGGEKRLIRAVFMGAAPLVLAAPWLIRNTSLYGDPFAQKAFTQAFVGSPQASVFIGELGAGTYWFNWVGWTTARSLIGVFGYMDIYALEGPGMKASDTIYRLALVVMIGLAAAGIIRAIKSEDKTEKSLHLVHFVAGAVIFVLFLRFNAQYYQAQARYLLPAISAIATVIGLGAVHLLKERKAFAWVLIAFVFGTISLSSYQTLEPAFQRRLSPPPTSRLEVGTTAKTCWADVTKEHLGGVLRPEEC
ncbi:MAG: glycosyltransferase family 39 protein [Fimbriimonadaceae bacterium]|nr:glycosyltransferase family 39 protein [Fimbriimonadaceae bacterium]